MGINGLTWLAELKQAWRGLLRRPDYLLVASLTLALGVATTCLVFALLDQALFRPLPFIGADRLVTVGLQTGEPGSAAQTNVGAPGFYAATKRMDQFESVGTIQTAIRNVNIALNDTASVVPGAYADKGFLQTLGLQPVFGRNFSEQEDAVNGPQSALLSYDLWQRSFGADPGILSRSIQVEGKPVPIIGVLPKNFAWPDRFDLLLSLQPDLTSTSTATNQFIVARLKQGVSRDAASAQIDAALRSVMRTQMSSDEAAKSLSKLTFGALPIGKSIFSSRSNNILWMFLAAALCVLAIAAVNLANLMLLRTISRDHDTAIRAALGASPGRLVSPAVAEAVLIGLCGAIIGLAMAWLAVPILGKWIPIEWVRGQPLKIGSGTVIFSLVSGVAAALLGATIAILRSRRKEALAELGSGAKSGLGRGSKVLARALIVVQIAVATILLLGASLFARSLQKLSQVPMGFQSQSIVTFDLSPLRERVRDIDAVAQQTGKIVDLLQNQPEVQMAGASTNLPTGSQLNMYMQFSNGSGASTQYRPVSQNVRAIFGIPLLSGRDFDEKIDRVDSTPVCIISASLSNDLLAGKGLDQVINLMTESGPLPMRVVGIVGDVKQFGPAEPAPPIVYVPLGQVPSGIWTLLRDFRPLSYAVSVHPGTEAQLMQRLPGLIRQASPDQPISSIGTMTAIVASTTQGQRLNLLIVGVFSTLALLLAAVGLYAVMSVAVASRTHEFGVRAALGATPAKLLQAVLRESLAQLALGLVIGLIVALALSRLAERFLYQISAADVTAIMSVTFVLLMAGIVATLIPAWRASKVHPMEALRVE
ncbi:ABC transporter permease [Solilutibacter silvestris]|uniref:MacB-like periplasmic core domain n=1 Tax=Solilutibacter silvestris TaxID=1645665 RepID=A0A2K1Q1D9_9GAMM|nr:ABC transporter permease [Lysobacter silvestris]PNS08851.1 MacB-like periplasmic core domain [Lysobacter silvestris]